MLRSFKIVLVLLLVALVPARAIGSVTISICAAGQELAGAMHHAGAADHGVDAHESGHGDHAKQASDEVGSHTCGYCAAHCAGVAFAVPTELSRAAPASGSDRISSGYWSDPGFFPDHPDRPPLVS